MGQIWDRIRRIAQSYREDVPDFFPLEPDSSEEELSRIIDELNQEQTKREQRFANENASSSARQQQQQQSRKQEERTQQPPKQPSALDEQRALSLLGLSLKATTEDIKRAYKQEMLRFHPDRVTTLPPLEQQRAQQRARDVNAAYQTLRSLRNF